MALYPTIEMFSGRRIHTVVMRGLAVEGLEAPARTGCGLKTWIWSSPLENKQPTCRRCIQYRKRGARPVRKPWKK